MKPILAATEEVSLIRQDCTGYDRCYTSLASWEAAFGGIDFGACATGDLVCADKIAIAQISGEWSSPDTAPLVINGWETDSTRYIKIYTDSIARQAGKWDETKYRLVVTGSTAISISEDFVRIDGLQVQLTVTNTYKYGIDIRPADGADIQISNSIIKGNLSEGANNINGVVLKWNADGTRTFKFWNNVLYNWVNGTNTVSAIWFNASWVSYCYNNTVYNSNIGFNTALGTTYLKNNISYNNVDNYSGNNFHADSTNNLSGPSQSDAPGLNPVNNASVIFTDENNGDFHLSTSDVNAKEQGEDLSIDGNFALFVDIDGESRSAPWDIGADESAEGSLPPADTTPPVRSNGSPSGTLAADTTSTTLSLSTNEIATCRWSTTPNTAYANMVNTFSSTGATSHSTSISGLTNGASYTYYIRCSDQIGNSNTDDFSISFSIALPADATPPVRSNGSPSGTLAADTTSTTLSLSTNEIATCRWSTTPNTAYANMVNTFSSTGATSHSTSISGLTNGASYTYYIRCSDQIGNSNTDDFSINFSIALPGVTDIQAPSVPTNLTAVAPSSSQVNLSWSASTDNVGVTGYRLRRNGVVLSTTANTSYSDTTVSAQTSYTYTVSAYDVANNESGQSTQVQITTPVAPVATGNIHYIRSGATGNNSGNDWLNAFAALPNELQRGHAYYIADGSYGSYDFNDPVSGTEYITIKKATLVDHGTDTGWNSGYGDGVAEFSGSIPSYGSILSFSTDYWIFDGQIGGGPGSWDSGFGFKVKALGCDDESRVVMVNNGADYIDFYHSEIEGCTAGALNTLQARTTGFYSSESADGGSSNILVSHTWIHTVTKNPMILSNVTNSTVEYSHLSDRIGGYYDPAQPTWYIHGEAITFSFCGSQANNTVKYNYFKNIYGTNFIAIKDSVQSYFYIYGNIFYQSDALYVASNGIVSDTAKEEDSTSYTYFYNNYIINNISGTSGIQLYQGANNYAYNNLWYNCRYINHANLTHDYNYYSNTTFVTWPPNPYTQGAHDILATGDPFVDFVNGDFSLKQGVTAVDSGVDLDSPYNFDMFGTSRPQGASYDIGAYEYIDSSTSSDTTPPVRSAGSPSSSLAIGTTSTTLSLTTNENATCRWSTTVGTSYASMTNTFSTTGSTAHSTSVTGLVDGTTYHYYVRCSDAVGNANITDFDISFSVSADITPPTRSAGSPSDTLSVGTASTTLSLITNENATCRWSTAANTSYLNMANTFSTTGTTAHSTSATGLINGTTYYYYVRCRDAAGNMNQTDFQINFSVGSDTTAPARSNGQPSNTLPAGRTSTTLSLTTSENAICRYGTTANTEYINLPLSFTSTNSTSHTTSVSGLSNGTSYSYYIRCIDRSGNMNTNDYAIQFSVATPVVVSTPVVFSPVGGGGGGGSAIVSTPAPVVVSSPEPKNFRAITESDKIYLDWQNPTDDFAGVQVLRSTNVLNIATSTLNILSQGTIIYEGSRPDYIDTSVERDVVYHYYLLAYDHAGNYSKPLQISASLTSEEKEVSAYAYVGLKHLGGQPGHIVNEVSLYNARLLWQNNQPVNLSAQEAILYQKVAEEYFTDKTQDQLKFAISLFIHKGTQTTDSLGSGERAGVVNSFYTAYGHLPESETDWQDIIKMGNGRWPEARNTDAENRAITQFEKVYKRKPDRIVAVDDNAVMIITYGLRPANRNLNSEKTAIKTFKAIFGANPATALDWDTVRMIAYSGARR
ncbi:MAG: choice-of-anchor Q domain-containing protein [Patescibacteria group bacterium]